jgi:hypothetical protein
MSFIKQTRYVAKTYTIAERKKKTQKQMCAWWWRFLLSLFFGEKAKKKSFSWKKICYVLMIGRQFLSIVKIVNRKNSLSDREILKLFLVRHFPPQILGN